MPTRRHLIAGAAAAVAVAAIAGSLAGWARSDPAPGTAPATPQSAALVAPATPAVVPPAPKSSKKPKDRPQPAPPRRDAPPAEAAQAAPSGRATADTVLGPVLAGGLPATPGDPVTLAAHLTVAEDVARDPGSSPARVSAAGWVAQMSYRALGYRPQWDAAVLAAVPQRYRKDVRRHADARREFIALAGDELPKKLPAWRIVKPLPAADLTALYQEADRRFGVPWEVLAAINLIETGMGRIVGFSSAGAVGPMQFIPQTWAAYGLGGDVRNTRDAIMGAANYLRARGGADGTDRGLRRALYSYNNTQHYVRAIRDYAAILQDDPRAYPGLHAWRIYYRTPRGDVLLPVGYSSRKSIPVDRYLAGESRALR